MATATFSTRPTGSLLQIRAISPARVRVTAIPTTPSGRVKTITHADSSNISYSYNGRATQITDENLVSRIVQVDGLGRPTAVCEVSSVTLYSVSPVNCGLDISATGFLTNYVYSTDTTNGNALKTAVTQGQRPSTRVFETDWLGRATQVTQPESGTTAYSYTYRDGRPGRYRVCAKANQTGNTPTTTTTQYDSIGRVVTITYTDGTPNRAFGYDTNCCWAQGGANVKGRLAGTGGGTGSTWNGSSISYDAMGRVVAIWACGPATCGTGYQASRPLSFAYDWAGNLTQESDM